MKRIEGEWRYFDEALGIPYPWLTSTSLKEIEQIDFKGKRIFEYGAGDSTTWFKKKGAQVWSVDNDFEWASKMDCKFASYFHEYVFEIDGAGMFDIIVVDGAWRDHCVQRSWGHLKPGGILIVDNYQQPSVPTEWEYTPLLIMNEVHKIFKEPDHQDWQTLIVFK